jgi:hypothetical protein
MKANELRINNYFKGEPYTFDFLKILELRNEFVVFEGGSLFFENIQPIPLTEEWLLKFGFEAQVFTLTKRYKSKCGNLLFYIMPDNVVFANGVINDIRLESVHQLQNLHFALTNEELILKN